MDIFFGDNIDDCREAISAILLDRPDFLSKAPIGRLSQREAHCLKMRFGAEGVKKHTHKESGNVLGLSYERARQIEFKAIRKIKSLMLDQDAKYWDWDRLEWKL